MYISGHLNFIYLLEQTFQFQMFTIFYLELANPYEQSKIYFMKWNNCFVAYIFKYFSVDLNFL